MFIRKLTRETLVFKNNNTAFYRQVISDDTLTAFQKFIVDWDHFNPEHLDETKNTITQEYDALNRIRKATYPADRDGPGKEMIPKYNKGGALFSLRMDGAEYVKEVAYNAKGQRILIAMGNSIMTRYAYDPKTFRVLRQRSALYTHSGHTYTPNAGVRQDMQYTYDLEGTITSMNDAAPANTYAQGPGNLLRLFTHDPLRRLLSATGRETSNVYTQPSWDLNIRPQDYTKTNTYLRRYEYDKIGNIQRLKHEAAGHSNQDFERDYSYGSTDNKLVGFTVNSNLYANKYDANGNLTKEGESRYFEWNANDKLAVFKNQAGSSTPSVYTNYFYNSQGERVKKHTRKGNKIVVTFYMDGGMFETTYTKTVGGSIDNNRFYNTIKISNDGALIATIQIGKNVDDKTPEIKYIVGDHLNNSTAVLKATTGSLINREEYYPFGETSFGGFAYKRYRYNGKEKDAESGLYEYGQRYYAPWLCRFVSVDPIAEDYPQLSSYNYAGNKPITSPDIEGLQGSEDAKVFTDGAGREAIIDPGAEIVEADTAVISQEGDKYVNVNGVGLVKESYLTNTDFNQNLNKLIINEIFPRALVKSGEIIKTHAARKATEKVSEGTLVGTNDKIYQSSYKTKTGNWAHKGNQYFTTKGIDPLRHPKILGWKNMIGKSLISLGQISGIGIGIAEIINDDRQNPFSLLPISFITDSQLNEYDKLDQEFLEMAISKGYESVKQHLAAQSKSKHNLAVANLILEDIQPDILLELFEGRFSNYDELLEGIYSNNQYKSYGILLKLTYEAPGFQLIGVFNKSIQ